MQPILQFIKWTSFYIIIQSLLITHIHVVSVILATIVSPFLINAGLHAALGGSTGPPNGLVPSDQVISAWLEQDLIGTEILLNWIKMKLNKYNKKNTSNLFVSNI